MRKTHDYIHRYRGYWSDGGKCRIRIYREDGCVPVVICSELPNNDGSSVTYSAHQIAAEVIRYNEFASPPVWIEHYPKESTDGTLETFELVVLSSYEIRERAPYLGETRLTIGEPDISAHALGYLP
jgi:hypothetical protein